MEYSLCIFCQTIKAKVPVSSSTEHGLNTVTAAASSRRKLKDLKNQDVIDRLDNTLASATNVVLVWHKSCYAHFTDKSKIERLQRSNIEQSKEEAGSSGFPVAVGNRFLLRKKEHPVNSGECIVCQITDKKQRLISVMTKQMSDRILQASHLDYKVGIRLAGVIDLIAAEA